ncbi:hypothetical protein FRC10_010104 [Ceratobasidium sp. 414]|nr:hypothetical protein FRC10_010104 [Ceratobasidium sp. 414]
MNFKLAFCHTLPHQYDSNLLSLLSPSGKRLASTGKDGIVIITQVPDGKSLASIELDSIPRITCLGWAASSNILIGDNVGRVMQVNVMRNPVPSLFKSYVRAVAFDTRRRLLAIALDGEVQIWRLYLVNEVQQDWEAIDILKCEHNGIEQRVSSVEFFGAHHYLLITTDHGLIIWKDEDKPLLYFERNLYNLPLM